MLKCPEWARRNLDKDFSDVCSQMSAGCSKKAMGDFAVESVESHLKVSQCISVHKVVVVQICMMCEMWFSVNIICYMGSLR